MGRYNSKLELRTHKVKLPQVNKYNKFNISVLKIIRIQKNGTKISRSRNRFGYNLLLCRCISTREGGDHCQRSRQSNNAVIRSFYRHRKAYWGCCEKSSCFEPIKYHF